jgi:hypothetical protein
MSERIAELMRQASDFAFEYACQHHWLEDDDVEASRTFELKKQEKFAQLLQEEYVRLGKIAVATNKPIEIVLKEQGF